MRLRFLLFMVMVTAYQAGAQIYGNGKIVTETIELKDLRSIDIQLNADIVLDYNQKEMMTITTDENVISWIGKQFANGHLTLDQIKWIEPRTNPVITIGCPALEKVYQGTHSETTIINMKMQDLTLEGNVGRIIAEGSARNIKVITTGTTIDLSKAILENAYVSIDDDSKVTLNKVSNLKTNLNKRARLILMSKPISDDLDDDYENPVNGGEEMTNQDLRFIDLEIKNNSFKRNHFVIVGPKKDGTTFSYGFSLLPGLKKKERWSIGSKVYKEKRSGARELLVTITENDEGATVKLFK